MRVYLVQRLKKPANSENIFAFGGGLKNGGIGKEAMDIIRKVMSFDYMGSAEFEWGAVPTALQVLNEGEIVDFELIINGVSVFVICLSKDKDEVEDWIRKAANNKHDHLKERLGFKEALVKEKYADSVGWLKIEEDRHCESPFMFFTDKQMYENTLQLFTIKQKESVLITSQCTLYTLLFILIINILWLIIACIW